MKRGDDPDKGSAVIDDLYQDAKQLLLTTPVVTIEPINSKLLLIEPIGRVAQFKLVDAKQIPRAQSCWGKTSYFLRYDSHTSSPASQARNARPAYYLPYNGASQLRKDQAFIDIPKRPDQPLPDGGGGGRAENVTVLFTGILSGCSVVVTSLDDTHYRVFHDSRTDASDLYDQLVAAIDYRDYVARAIGSWTSVLMQYSSKSQSWSLHAQGLCNLKMFDEKGTFIDDRKGSMMFDLRNLPAAGADGGPVLTRVIDPNKTPRAWVADERVGEARRRREEFREQMDKIANEYKSMGLFVLPKPDDGDFIPGDKEPNLDSPAVLGTQAYIKIFRKFIEEAKLVKKGVRIPGVSIKTGDVDGLIARLGAVGRECDELDRNYLWQLMREHGGEEAVIDTGDPLRVELWGDTTGERYDALEVRLLARPSQGVMEGYTRAGHAAAKPAAGPSSAGHESEPSTSQATTASKRSMGTNLAVGRPTAPPSAPVDGGAPETATLLEMKRSCVHLLDRLTDQELGALLRCIENTAREERLGWLMHGPQVVEQLLSQGGRDAKPMPLDVMYRLEGSGYCYVLVRVVAAALWAEGTVAVDQFLAKLASLRTATPEGSREASLLLGGLQELRGNVDALAALKPIGRMTLDKVINYLQVKPGTATRLLALNTQTHSMLLCATVRKTSYTESDYHFYDPNFAMVTYDSSQALLGALNRHLLEGGFAEAYNAYGTKDVPEFNLHEIHGAKLAQVDVDSGLVVEDLGSENPLAETVDSSPGLRRQGPDRAARELLEDPAFKKAVMAGTAVSASTWNGPWMWEGKQLIRVPEDSVLSMYAGMYGLQLDDDERPGFSRFS